MKIAPIPITAQSGAIYNKSGRGLPIMASSTSHLYAATPDLSLHDQANAARNLLAANELYRIWNSSQYAQTERRKALGESRALTEQVLAELPKHAGALNLLARIEMDDAQFAKAEQLILEARKQNPNDENIELNYGYLLLAQKQFDAAQAQFLSILELHPKSERAFSGIALAKLRSGDYLGAMNHYRRLIELGLNTTNNQKLLVDSMEFLSAENYQPDVEALLLDCFEWEDIDASKLSNLATSQIVAKYDLHDEHAILDLDALLCDPLLVHAISKCLLTAVEAEGLITELRRVIMTEVSMTENLRDELLPLAIAIGQYAARSDYILMMSSDEEQEVSALTYKISASTNAKWQIDDLAGALIILSMYEPLYSQAFSFKLLAHDLNDWPMGMQSLLQSNLYELCDEHQIYCDIFGINAQNHSNNEIKRASERWSALKQFNRSSLYTALCQELDEKLVPERFCEGSLNVLLVGCGSGQRALYLANYFDGLNVFAVDASRENIAYANLKAREQGLDNVQFIHSEYEHALISEHQFDIIEFSDDINHVENIATVLDEWQLLLKEDGLIRLNFATQESVAGIKVINQLVKDRRLSPTIDNIRHLRDAIIRESSSGLWSKLFQDQRFYTGSGCRDLFFKRHNHAFDLKDIDALLKRTNLSFIGFADQEQLQIKHLNDKAAYSLLAWHVMDQDNALFKERYSLYCKING